MISGNTYDFQKRTSFHAQGELKLPKMHEVKASGGYLTWGDDNMYPQYLDNLFLNSALHNAIVLQKTDWIAGNGLYSPSDNIELTAWIKKCNRKGDSLNDIFKKCVFDYELFGGFALQIVYTNGSSIIKPQIAEIYHVDIKKLRYNREADKIKYAKHWGEWRAKVIEYDLYDDSNPIGTQILYYNGPITREWYPVPTYIGSVTGIETDIEIANYQLSIVKTGFFPSISIDFKNGEPTEEEKSFMERRLKELWGGSGNAGKMLLTFSDADNPGPEITPIAQPDLDSRFLQSADYVQSRIMIGHKIPPVLVGVQVAGKLGLGNEYNEAFQKFQNTYIQPAQTKLLDIFNRLCAINISVSDLQIIPIRPLSYVWINEDVMASQMTTSEVRDLLVNQGVLKSAALKPGDEIIGFKNNLKPPTQAAPVESGDTNTQPNA